MSPPTASACKSAVRQKRPSEGISKEYSVDAPTEHIGNRAFLVRYMKQVHTGRVRHHCRDHMTGVGNAGTSRN